MKVCLVCSQGGHLTETLQILVAFEGHDIFFATYCNSREAELKEITRTYAIPYTGVNPLSAFRYLLWALRILIKERPDVIFSTGAEIALPFFYLGKLVGTKLIYLEGMFSVTKPSKTGRLVYPLSDLFLVQWPQLLDAYGKKARCEGAVI